MGNFLRPEGPLVLIVEDEAIIGYEVADALLEERYRVVGPFNSCARTLHCLAENRPDVAILDVLLRDGPSTEIARELRKACVPFLVYSGSLPGRADAAFAGAPWLEKPTSTADLLTILAQITSDGHEVPGLVAHGQCPRGEAQRQAA
jgi:DNA-binding response OmpR family regulator